MDNVINIGAPTPEPEPAPVDLLNASDEMQRQPTVEEMHKLLRNFFTQLHSNDEISETTWHKLCWFVDKYVPLLDGEWWTEEGGPDDV